MRKRNFCRYCYHHEDSHEFAADRRTPIQANATKFECSDCDLCRREHVNG